MGTELSAWRRQTAAAGIRARASACYARTFAGPPETTNPGLAPCVADETGFRQGAAEGAWAESGRSPEAARDDPVKPRPTASPEARHAAKRFTTACLEILNGYRPVAHLRSLARPMTAHTLVEQLLDAVARMPAAQKLPRRQRPELVKLRRIRISEPTPGVVEAAAAVGTESRTWAMAFRLEHHSDTWQGTVLQVL